MPNELVHIKAMIKRQTSAGTLAILFLFIILFGGRVFDFVRGEPWIGNELVIVLNSQGQTTVEDIITTRNIVRGYREVYAETLDGTTICRTHHSNTWYGEKKQFWRVAAFMGCKAPEEPFRICSVFSVRSESGREKSFGPFCSQPAMISTPTTENPV